MMMMPEQERISVHIIFWYYTIIGYCSAVEALPIFQFNFIVVFVLYPFKNIEKYLLWKTPSLVFRSNFFLIG